MAHYLEAAGVATTGITLVREQTEVMRPPRFLWVPFELGRPFGAPDEPEFQRRVLHDALKLLERTDGPVVLADFPDDAPSAAEDVAWSCPITFAPASDDATDITTSVRAEMGRLAAWAELAPAPTPNSPRPLPDLVTLLDLVASGDDPTDRLDDRPLLEAVRLAADDLHTWYLHAAAHQPGAATSAERVNWFWRQTALGRLIGAVAARLAEDPDPTLRLFATRGLVPRDHWTAVMPGR